MLKFNKEYYNHPYYLFLKENANKFVVLYSTNNTMSEAKKGESRMEFDKKDLGKVDQYFKKLFKGNKNKKTSEITKELKAIKSDNKQEVDEFIDDDGTLSTSKVPIINNRLAPKKTLDQTVISVMQTNNPVTRGYRVYYGESKDGVNKVIKELSTAETELLSNIPKRKSEIMFKIENSESLSDLDREKLYFIIKNVSSVDLPYEIFLGIKKGIIKIDNKVIKLSDNIVDFFSDLVGKKGLSEINYSDAFGYEETKDMDGKKTFKYLRDELGMEPIEAAQRTKEFGKDYTGNRKKNVPKKIKNDPNFIDKLTLSEIERQKMIKMVEDILSKKKDDGEIYKKENKVSKILIKNLQSIKKIAEKEGISIAQLVKILKTNE